MQIALRRASELANAMVRDANFFSYAPVWTNSRSIFELAALLDDAKERLRVILQKWHDNAYQDFCDHLDAILLDTRMPVTRFRRFGRMRELMRRPTRDLSSRAKLQSSRLSFRLE